MAPVGSFFFTVSSGPAGPEPEVMVVKLMGSPAYHPESPAPSADRRVEAG
jgi:hypothetical protein